MDVGEVHDGIVLRKRFVVIEFQVVDTFEPSFELVFLSRVLLAHNHMYIRQDMPPRGRGRCALDAVEVLFSILRPSAKWEL